MSRTRAFRIITVCLFSLSLAAGCSWTDKDKSAQDEYEGWSAQQFYQEAKKMLTQKYYEKAINLYEKLEARYPFGPQATQAQLEIAYAYYKNQESESALAAVDRFIKLNPTHPSVDYAYYLKGLINYNRDISMIDRFLPTDSSQRDPGAATEALNDFNELIRKFPNSRYIEDAKQRLSALRNNLAMHEMHVARFYMRREAYLAAARRAAYVIEKYQRTQAVPEALQIMEQAYRQMEMDDLADDAARVYAMNYANGVPSVTSEAGLAAERSLLQKFWDVLGFDKD